jgi:hypothetical protein
VVALERDHQRAGTDIDSDKDRTHHFGHQKAPFAKLDLRFPDPESSPADLVTQALHKGASDTPRYG